MARRRACGRHARSAGKSAADETAPADHGEATLAVSRGDSASSAARSVGLRLACQPVRPGEVEELADGVVHFLDVGRHAVARLVVGDAISMPMRRRVSGVRRSCEMPASSSARSSSSRARSALIWLKACGDGDRVPCGPPSRAAAAASRRRRLFARRCSSALSGRVMRKTISQAPTSESSSTATPQPSQPGETRVRCARAAGPASSRLHRRRRCGS